ncbi:hypothetical protein OSTOST_03482 [Ostertagia ostertagi]
MSASGYVKGQITRATNALKEKLTAAEQTMIEFYAVKDSKEDLEKDSKTSTRNLVHDSSISHRVEGRQLKEAQAHVVMDHKEGACQMKSGQERNSYGAAFAFKLGTKLHIVTKWYHLRKKEDSSAIEVMLENETSSEQIQDLRVHIQKDDHRNRINLNTRPITPVLTNESENGFVLRPIDLINPYFTPRNIDRSNTNNLINTLDSHEKLTTSYTALQETLEMFWKYWQKDYLQNLAERNQTRIPFKQGAKDSPKKGDVVLIKQENISRSHWPLGIIVQINKSVDGLIRSVKIKTVRSTPPAQRGPTQQLRFASTSPPSQPRDNFSSSRSSPFIEPELESSWAEQMTAETAKDSTQYTAATSKDDKKKQGKVEAEIASGIAALSVGKDADKEQEAMDTTDVAQEGQASAHEANPDTRAPAIENGQQDRSHLTSKDEIINEGPSTSKITETKEEVLKRRKQRMEAVTTFLDEFTRQPEARDPPGPLRTNPAPTSFMRRPEVTPYSTLNVEPYTVEELTARQFRSVFDYITQNNLLRDRVRNIQIPDKESTPTRPSDYEAVAKIVHTLQTLLELVQQTTKSFHNLAVILVRRLPMDFRFTHLMGWIHELTHGITSITVNRDILQELTLPRLFQWSRDQNYFRATLQLFNVTEETSYRYTPT